MYTGEGKGGPDSWERERHKISPSLFLLDREHFISSILLPPFESWKSENTDPTVWQRN